MTHDGGHREHKYHTKHSTSYRVIQAVVTTTQGGDSTQVLQVHVLTTALTPLVKPYAYKVRSVADLRNKLREDFQEQVSSTVDFNVGYSEGSQQARVWLVTPDDINSVYMYMYLHCDKGGPVTLW